MKTTAKTMLMTAALAVAFLSAGTFAQNGNGPVAVVQKSNLTVISKNSAWPILVEITPEACKSNRCISV